MSQTLPGFKVLISALTLLNQSNLSGVAATTWLTYDIMITLGDEIQCIWGTRWSAPKFLYFASRYYGLFNLVCNTAVSLEPALSVKFCGVWTWFLGFSGTVFFTTTVNLVLLLRIYALYCQSKKVLVFLLSLFFTEFVTEVVVTVLTIHQVHYAPKPPGVPLLGCFTTHPPSLTLVAWIPCLAIACVFFSMTLYKFYLLLKEPYMGVVSPSHSFAPLASLFLRDGALSFVMIFAVILMNTLFNIIVRSGPLLTIGSPWLMATYSLAGSRLILNLRGVSSQTVTTANSHMELQELDSRTVPVFKKRGMTGRTVTDESTMFTDTIIAM